MNASTMKIKQNDQHETDLPKLAAPAQRALKQLRRALKTEGKSFANETKKG